MGHPLIPRTENIDDLIYTLHKNRYTWGATQHRKTDPWTLELINECAKRATIPRDRALAAVALRLGLRPGEAARMRSTRLK